MAWGRVSSQKFLQTQPTLQMQVLKTAEWMMLRTSVFSVLLGSILSRLIKVLQLHCLVIMSEFILAVIVIISVVINTVLMFISFLECCSRRSLQPVACIVHDCRPIYILLMDACWLYGLWSAVGRIHSRLIWQASICVGLETWALT